MRDHNRIGRLSTFLSAATAADIAALFVLFVGVLGGLGWALNVFVFHSELCRDFAMKPNLVVSFLLAGLALLFQGQLVRAPRLARLCAGLVLGFCGLSVFEYLSGAELPFDSLFVRQEDGSAFWFLPHCKRGPLTTVCFTALSMALLALPYKRITCLAHCLAFSALLLGAVTLVGFLYGTIMRFGLVNATPIGPNAAALFIVLSLGIFFTPPLKGLPLILIGDTLGGWSLRRLLPVAVIVPLLFGWVQLYGEWSGQYDSAFRISIMMVLLMFVVGVAMWFFARELNRAENARNVAEDLTRENEKDYHDQFVNSSVVMIMIDPDNGQIVDANNAALAFYGYTYEQIRAKTIYDLNPMPAEKVRVVMMDVRDGQGGRFEFQHRLADGSLRDITAFTSRIRFGGRIVLHSIINDITDRKLAEAELRRSEEKYRLLAQNSVTAIATHRMIFDERGKPVDYVFLSANPAFEAQTGLRVADVIGRRITEILPGIEKTTFIETYGKVVVSGEPVTFEQYAEQLNRHFFVNAYRLDEGCFATVFADITERKRAEQGLKEREAFLSLLLETVPIPVFYKDTAGRYVLVNKAFETLFWKSKADLIGKTVFDALPEDLAQTSHEEDRKLFEHPGVSAYYSQVQDGMGIMHNVIFQKATLVDAQGKAIGLIGTILNITDQQRLEDELRETRQQLEEATDLASLSGKPPRKPKPQPKE